MTTEQSNGLPMAGTIYHFGPNYVHDVILRALEHRSEASDSVRDALNSAIADTVRLDGFHDASKAQPPQLSETVLASIRHGNDRLAAGVFRSWMESHEELRDVVSQHLVDSGIPVDGPDFRERVFGSCWPRGAWTREIETLVASRGDLDPDDIGLMLCCVSGRAPAEDDLTIESPLFIQLLERLGQLPPDAPEWEEVDAFIDAVSEAADMMIIERHLYRARALNDALTAMQADFESELRYVGIDLASWDEQAAAKPRVIADGLTLANELNDNLLRYQPVRPQADSREEEAARATERAKIETSILRISDAWEELISSANEPSMPETEVPGVAESPAEKQAGPANHTPGAAEPESIVSKEEREDALGELDRLRREGESLRAENARLAQSSSDLESDKRALDVERSDLKGELSRSRAMAETWRRSYVDARVGGTDAPSEAPPRPASVNEAVALAEQSFPDRLVFALNSKSDRNSQFQKPNEVFEALAWLATVYHERRTSPGTRPDFDLLLRESCSGWSFKTGQTEVTTEQFDEWYSTTVDGKRYDLGPHLGKGNSRDPKSTIRIAFAWDEERQQVIVGYIGRHQRNRRT